MTQLKPGRRLGAAWIDSFVSNRRAVSLCAECQHRYGDWDTRNGYSARDRLELSDCDGCGQVLQVCKGYFASLM